MPNENTQNPTSKGTMLILRGIKNLLHETPALAYAKKMGYVGEVLQASGENGPNSDQANKAIARIQKDDVTALYGFSGGGYNCRHIWNRLNAAHKAKIQRIVVLGSPGVQYNYFKGCPEIIIFNNDQVAHMDQPDYFLKLMS